MRRKRAGRIRKLYDLARTIHLYNHSCILAFLIFRSFEGNAEK